jgi:hypothetical protein
MASAAPPLFAHPLRPTALPALAAGFVVLALLGLLVGLGRAAQPQVGLPLAALGVVGAGLSLLAAWRTPRQLRLTEAGVELVSRRGVHRLPWSEVRAVVRAEPRREVAVAAYALQLSGDREVWLEPTADTAPALREWMDRAAERAGLVWVGHRALPPERAPDAAGTEGAAAAAARRRWSDEGARDAAPAAAAPAERPVGPIGKAG